MEDARDVIELVGDRVDRAGLCIVGPSARMRVHEMHNDRTSGPYAGQVNVCSVLT